MSSTAIDTVVKMLEGQPDAARRRVVEHLREYLSDMLDDARWDASFERIQSRLAAEARCIREDIESCRARPLDLVEL